VGTPKPPALPRATRCVAPAVNDSCLPIFLRHVALKPVHGIRRTVGTLNHIHYLSDFGHTTTVEHRLLDFAV